MDKVIVPVRLATDHGWEVTIASQRRAAVPGGVRNLAYGGGRLDSLRCLWEVAGRTDVLHLIHFNPQTIIRAMVFKARNPAGLCYVRLGAHTRLAELERRVRAPVQRAFLRLGLEITDLVSAESTAALERFRAFAEACGPRRRPETMLVSACGYDPDRVLKALNGADGPVAGEDILFVGRVGAPVKATDLLLDAFALAREGLGVSCRLDLVGPVDPGFLEILDRWSLRVRPETRAALTMSGPVWDRDAVMERYLRAKVFVISSRSEGGPTAFVEAGSCGCLLVGTAVGQVPDVVAAAGRGWEVPVGDAGALARALAEAVATRDTRTDRDERIRRFGQRYSWAVTTRELAQRLTALTREAAARGTRRSA